MYRALVTDMDGTLLRDDKTISKFNKEMITKIKDEKKIILASARGLYGLDRYLEELGLLNRKDQYTIAFNGSYIIRNDHEVLYDAHIDLKAARYLIIYLLVNAPELEVFIYNKDGIKSLRDINDLDSYLKATHIYKIGARGMTDSVLKWRHNLPKEIYDYMEVTNSDLYSFECVTKGMTKCEGLKKLCSILDIRAEEVIACGDGENDVEMIEYAGLGVAMANGLEILKKRADYISSSNNDDGVGKVIERFMLDR